MFISVYYFLGTCALSEAEDRCDSEICKILIHEGGADTKVLEKVLVR